MTGSASPTLYRHGPCTRCGYRWKSPLKDPSGCARCCSSRWRDAPQSPRARRPSTPWIPRNKNKHRRSARSYFRRKRLLELAESLLYPTLTEPERLWLDQKINELQP